MDLSSLLSEVSADQPCGPNLDEDPEFQSMERAALGKPEAQYGSTIIPAVPADWKAVCASAENLLQRTRDVRVTVLLARGLLHTAGVSGFTDGLALTHEYLARFWDRVHPELDPDDDNDPTSRVNAVASLADANTTLRELREAPLVAVPAHGRFSLRDIEVASGEVPPPKDQPVPQSSAIDAAFMDCAYAELQALEASLAKATGHAKGIEATITAQVGVARSADLSALTRLLHRLHGVVAERLAKRPDAAPTAPVEADGEASSAEAVAAPNKSAAERRPAGEVSSRADVVAALDRIIRYYSNSEPSSPVPLLLERAKKLVPLNFLDIMRELSPDAASQLEERLNGRAST